VGFRFPPQGKRVPKKPAAPTVESRLLNIKQTAAYMGATIWAIRSLAWSRAVPFLKIGNKILFDRKDLDSFIESNKVAAHG
jgi:excisionase family DNA binding protein